MFEQNQIQSAFRTATDFAVKLGSLTVETEHLLFGVLCDETSVASKLLNGLGVNKTKYASVFKSVLKNGVSAKPVLSKNVSLIYSKIVDSKGNVQDILYLLLSKKGFKSFAIISTGFGLDVSNILKKLATPIFLEKQYEKN